MGGFVGSVVLSIIAVGRLNYFFVEPLFSFRVDYPNDIFAIGGFLPTSFIVCGLTAKVRRDAEQAPTLQRDLIETFLT